MDPAAITAVAGLVTELTKLVRVVIESQPKDVQEKLWRIYLQDLQNWRRFFGIPDPPEPLPLP